MKGFGQEIEWGIGKEVVEGLTKANSVRKCCMEAYCLVIQSKYTLMDLKGRYPVWSDAISPRSHGILNKTAVRCL